MQPFQNLFVKELSELGIRHDFNRIIFAILCASALASCLIFYFSGLDFSINALICLSVLILPCMLFYFYLDFQRDEHQKTLESSLPEALFQIASFPKNTSMEEIIDTVAKKENLLGSEFEKASNQIKSGFGTKSSLMRIASKNSSNLLSRCISLILEVYENGGEFNAQLNDIAQDIFEMHSIQKESNAAFSIQKYTLLAGVALFIPIILGLLTGIIFSLDFASNEDIFQNQTDPDLIPAILFSVQIYLFILSALSGIFLAMQEGRIKKAAVYFCMLFGSSAIVFNLVKNIRLI